MNDDDVDHQINDDQFYVAAYELKLSKSQTKIKDLRCFHTTRKCPISKVLTYYVTIFFDVFILRIISKNTKVEIKNDLLILQASK